MDQGPGDPRAHAAGHGWVALGMLLCLCFLLIISAKFSHPVKASGGRSWGDAMEGDLAWAVSSLPSLPSSGLSFLGTRSMASAPP